MTADDSDDDDDGQLALRAAAGNRESFRRLVDRHRNGVFRFAFHLLRDPHAAEDAAQDVFVKAFRRIGSFDPGRGAFGSWIATITRNTCLDIIARRRRETFDHAESIPEAARNESDVESREIFSILDRALDQLEEPFRSTFILAEIEEFPLREIADMQNIALGTVKSRVSRARERLRSHLEPLLSRS